MQTAKNDRAAKNGTPGMANPTDWDLKGVCTRPSGEGEGSLEWRLDKA